MQLIQKERKKGIFGRAEMLFPSEEKLRSQNEEVAIQKVLLPNNPMESKKPEPSFPDKKKSPTFTGKKYIKFLQSQEHDGWKFIEQQEDDIQKMLEPYPVEKEEQPRLFKNFS